MNIQTLVLKILFGQSTTNYIQNTMKRKTKHVNYIFNSIMTLNNDINDISIKISVSDFGSLDERLLVDKLKTKAKLLKKYNRRLKILTL